MAYEAGNTVRFTATFTDFAPEGELGDPVDPSDVTVILYNSDKEVISEEEPIQVTGSEYYYDWTLPTETGRYYIEFKGMVAGEPAIERTPITVKFNT